MSLKKMKPHDVRALQELILDSYIKGDYIRSKLLTEKMARIENKRQQRQIMKYLLDFFILKKYMFQNKFAQAMHQEIGTGRVWDVDLEQIQVAYAQKFIQILKDLVNSGRLEPQKITTISSLNSKFLTTSPDDFQFLFNEGFIQLGKNFKIKTGNSSVFRSAFRIVTYMSSRLYAESSLPPERKISYFLEKRGINSKLVYNIDKKRFYEVYNFFENVEFLYGKFQDSLRDQLRSLLLLELSSLFQEDERIIRVDKRRLNSAWRTLSLCLPEGERIYTQEERELIRSMLYKKGNELYSKLITDARKTEGKATDFFKPEELALV